MIPHIHTLFEFISIPYENQHQTLNIKKFDRGQNRVSRVFNYTTATSGNAMTSLKVVNKRFSKQRKEYMLILTCSALCMYTKKIGKIMV